MTVHESVNRDADKNDADSGVFSSGDGLVPDSDAGGESDLRDAKSSQKFDTIFRSLTVAAGAVIAAFGAVLTACAKPVHSFLFKRMKAKYGDTIVKLTSELLGEREDGSE